MARPREFDEGEALSRAQDLFWRKGYEATSLTELLEAMALSKSSFYETFGSKHDLFLRALARYQVDEAEKWRAALARSPARAAIQGVLEGLIGCAEHRGCMTCNEAVELGPHDASVEAKVAEAHDQLEKLVVQTVRRGQQEGSIATRQTPEDLGRLLMVSINGLQVMMRACANRAHLEETVRAILATLD